MVKKPNPPRWGIVVIVVAAAVAATTGLASAAPNGTTVIKTPYTPIFAASSGGAIWVGAHEGVVVYKINPRTNRIVRTVKFGRTPCSEAAAGPGAIFVGDCIDEGGNTLEISTKTNRVVRTFAGGMAVFGDASLWTVDPAGAHVLRFDPRTGVRLASIPTGLTDGAGGGLAFLGTFAEGAVWLGDDAAKTVLRIDTATNKVVAVIPLPGAATQASSAQGNAAGGPMVFAGGKIWCGNPAGIYEINPATNQATRLSLRIGDLDAWGDIEFAAGAGSVWVRNAGNTISRIDPATGNVIGSYPATGGGGGITIAYGSLWVANAGNNTVWREPIH